MTDAARPAPGIPRAGHKVSRRTFLSGLGLFVAAAAAARLPEIGSKFADSRPGQGPRWVTFGPLSGLAPGTPAGYAYVRKVKDGWSEAMQTGLAYVVADGRGGARAYANLCTHNGCRVTWQPDRTAFLCPCCGGLYGADGSVLSGPPPQPLEELPCRVCEGEVEVLLIVL